MKKQYKDILRTHRIALEESAKSFQDIYRIMFGEDTQNLILCESNDGYRITRHTYGQISLRIQKAAAALYEQIGDTHHYIALEMENCAEWIIAFWAILMSGNKPFLVNCRHPKALSDNLLKSLGITTTICLKPSVLETESLLFESLNTDNTLPADLEFENELAFSTSATSLNEVVVFFSGRQIAAQIMNFKTILKECPRIAKHYKGDLKQLAFLPFYHVFGLFAVYFWYTFFGKTLVFLRDYSADTILSTCRRHQVTHIFAVPMLWHTIEKKVNDAVRKKGEKKQQAFEKALRLSTKLQNINYTLGSFLAKHILKEVTSSLFGNSIVFCINGGSYIRPSAAYLLNGLGYSLHNGYGTSEIGITSVELKNKPKYSNKCSIGHPFDAVEYHVNEDGILLVAGDTLCFKKTINGQEFPTSKWYDTGDYVTFENGDYYISGRKSDVFIGENGENINPDLIEQHFIIPEAIHYVVLGMKHGEQEDLTMIVQINPYLSTQRIQAMFAEIYHANELLPMTSQVRKFYVTTSQIAPPTAVKVGRKYVQKGILEGTISLHSFSDYKTHSESREHNEALVKKVKLIIASELNISEAEIENTSHILLDLGGTSINYFSILGALAKEFDIIADTDADKYCYTPLEIAEYIERHI